MVKELRYFVFFTVLGRPIEARNLTRLFYKMIESKSKGYEFSCTILQLCIKLLNLSKYLKVIQNILGSFSILITLDTYSLLCLIL